MKESGEMHKKFKMLGRYVTFELNRNGNKMIWSQSR